MHEPLRRDPLAPNPHTGLRLYDARIVARRLDAAPPIRSHRRTACGHREVRTYDAVSTAQPAVHELHENGRWIGSVSVDANILDPQQWVTEDV